MKRRRSGLAVIKIISMKACKLIEMERDGILSAIVDLAKNLENHLSPNRQIVNSVTQKTSKENLEIGFSDVEWKIWALVKHTNLLK